MLQSIKYYTTFKTKGKQIKRLKKMTKSILISTSVKKESDVVQLSTFLVVHLKKRGAGEAGERFFLLLLKAKNLL